MAGLTVLADASTLISLAVIGCFDLLRDRHGKVLITDEVWSEVAERMPNRPGAAELKQAAADGWCVRIKVTAAAPVWQRSIDRGEAEVLTEGLQRASRGDKVLLLLDERDGRAEALRLGLKRLGVLGLLLDARLTGQIPLLRPLIDLLVANDFRMSPALLNKVLTDAGEAPPPSSGHPPQPPSP